MFKLEEYTVFEVPYCCDPVEEELFCGDFLFYDKDGFELCDAELAYYLENCFPLQRCLNHMACQQTWFTIPGKSSFILDHALILQRIGFGGDAYAQIKKYSKKYPRALHLLNTIPKWGYDLSLDYYDQIENQIVEIIHVEYDYREYEQFMEQVRKFESFVLTTDWSDVAHSIIARSDEWKPLVGFAQNDWKARFIGLPKAEITEKAIA